MSFALSALCWRRATLPLKGVPSPQKSLTSVFGMGTGVPSSIKHQHTTLNVFDFQYVCITCSNTCEIAYSI